MAFGVEFSGLNRLAIRLGEVPDAVDADLPVVMEEQLERLQATAAERMAELFRNPERMQASLSHNLAEGDSVVVGTVSASGLPYLRIQEFGGQTRPHDIFPVNAAALSWLSPGAVFFKGGSQQDRIFAKVVHHPGSKMPERSYMRSALAIERPNIVAAFRALAAEKVAA